MNQHLTEKQLAEAWNMSIRTLQRWRLEGKGPAFVRLGRSIRYPKDLAENFLKQNRQDPTARED
jgi:hypothetical protein